MHKNFGEWYRLVSIEPDGVKLQKRWAGVKAWAAALRSDSEGVLETVRIFQGIPSKTSRDAFLATFQKHDAAFPQRNDLELKVLAGASLVACVQSVGENDEGLQTAILAGTALEASSLRATEPRLEEIFREVLGSLYAIAVKQRERGEFDVDEIQERADGALEGVQQVSTATDWTVLKNALTPVLQTLVGAVQAAGVALSEAAHSLRSADEETSILWWLEGGCSRDTNKPWSALKEGAPIIAGVELADLTDVALGPRNAAALLERVLSESKSKGKESSLATYVNALPDEWSRHRSAVDSGAVDLTPLALAVAHRGKSGTTSWQQFFDASSGMKSSTQLSATRIARQAYVETMLLRALAEFEAEE